MDVAVHVAPESSASHPARALAWLSHALFQGPVAHACRSQKSGSKVLLQHYGFARIVASMPQLAREHTRGCAVLEMTRARHATGLVHWLSRMGQIDALRQNRVLL
jgi:hypothetical protein